MKSEPTKQERIKREEEYVEFLKRRLSSKHYKANVSEEEFEKTLAKYNKAKLVLKILKMSVPVR